jgi:lipid A 3-O-deacylase
VGLILAAGVASANESIWEQGPGSGFKDDTWHLGVSAGGGVGAEMFGGRVEHDLAVGQVSAGWIFTDLVAKEHWWRGNWELRGELFGGSQIEPARYMAGVTPGLRYHFATGTRLVPFVQGGAGLSATGIRQTDLSTTFEFNLMTGAGANFFITDGTALSLEYRLFHLSNAGIKVPNTGLNTHLLLAGISWWF